MKKIDLKGLTKSRFLRVSLIIIILIAATSFYMVKEKSLRLYMRLQLSQALEAKRSLEGTFVETIRAKEVVQKQLAAETEKRLSLERQVQEKQRQIDLALEDLEREISARRQAEARLLMTVKEKRTLEAKLKKFVQTSEAVKLEKIVVKPQPTLTGKVLAVNRQFSFVVVDLGKDNLQIGDVLSIYRNDEFVGKVQVEKVEERVSAASILPDWLGMEFKEDDQVRTI